jgi:hypothetical protein
LESAVLAAALAFVGCEWEGSDSESGSWNSRYSWVNFSGVYRGTGGGVLVTDYTVTSGTTGAVQRVESEVVGTARAGQSTYGGTFNNAPVRPRSVQIRAGVFVLTDNGLGVLSGSGKTGSIDYGTGGWSIDLLGEWPPAGSAITATYEYTVSGSSGAGSGGSGSSGSPVYSFTVNHQGNVLEIMDNNGRSYRGKLASVRTTGGITEDTPAEQQIPTAGTTVIGTYQAKGVSAAGMEVTMVGTFQGVVQGSGTAFSIVDRRMLGTWVEKHGRSGDINGQASPVDVTVAATE